MMEILMGNFLHLPGFGIHDDQPGRGAKMTKTLTFQTP
jgi:hypothetical protein